jgi:hypothetical protein
VPRRQTDTTVVIVFGDTPVAKWPLVLKGRPDLGVIDDLARLQLVARRAGCSIRLRGASPELFELLVLAGLAEVVGAENDASAWSGQGSRPRRPRRPRP